jgi:hypothetical protein
MEEQEQEQEQEQDSLTCGGLELEGFGEWMHAFQLPIFA